jgi:phosphohistidine phosphatase
MPAPKRLFILRHAKSSWDDPSLDDHDRPLAPRGRRAVGLLSAHLRANGIEPALVLCSSARRTRETLEGVNPGGRQLIEPGLYGAGASEILAMLQRLPEDVRSAMVIGHNPAMQMIVLRLAAGRTQLDAVREKFPTGALATLTFEAPWNELVPGAAELTAFVRPRDLV